MVGSATARELVSGHNIQNVPMFTQSIQKTVTSEPDLRFARRKKKEKRKKGKKTYKIGGMVTNGWMRWSRDPHSADWYLFY